MRWSTRWSPLLSRPPGPVRLRPAFHTCEARSHQLPTAAVLDVGPVGKPGHQGCRKVPKRCSGSLLRSLCERWAESRNQTTTGVLTRPPGRWPGGSQARFRQRRHMRGKMGNSGTGRRQKAMPSAPTWERPGGTGADMDDCRRCASLRAHTVATQRMARAPRSGLVNRLWDPVQLDVFKLEQALKGRARVLSCTLLGLPVFPEGHWQGARVRGRRWSCGAGAAREWL